MFRIACLVLVIVQVYGIHGDESVLGGAIAQIVDYIFHNIGDGNYRWGFSSTDGVQRMEEGVLENPETDHENFIVRGSYSYPDANGKMVKVKYTADKDGFHPEGDNIFVPAYDTNDKDYDQKDNKIEATQQSRFNRQFIENPPHNYEDNYQQVSHLQNHQNQNIVYRQQLPVQAENNDFHYDKSLIDLLGHSSAGGLNFEQQGQDQRPIIAIVGDDGRIIESSLDSENIPDSILELLGKSATHSIPKLTQQQVHDVMVRNGIPQMIEKALTEALRKQNIETDNASESSSVIVTKDAEPSTTPSTFTISYNNSISSDAAEKINNSTQT
ncbi:uncharacterized protein LOC116170143 [Photinus pyralis]|uniref:uncharacterized protein LOC116170143 n=1 Tax=Photinus pyralis TaxID=7054 RepID=UPI001266EC1C|nr:uncharacterized protein LOC116170143 [Photinus pyralis]